VPRRGTRKTTPGGVLAPPFSGGLGRWLLTQRHREIVEGWRHGLARVDETPVCGTVDVDTGEFVGMARLVAREEIDADRDFDQKRELPRGAGAAVDPAAPPAAHP
jgi:hypothetical protein